VKSTSVSDANGTWKSNKKIAIGDNYNVSSPDFRVGRSFSWESPHINFQTGTGCM
jgi:autotransporter adhesin